MVLSPGPPYLLTPTVIPCCRYRDLWHPSISSPLAPLKQPCEMSDDLCIFPGSVHSPALQMSMSYLPLFKSLTLLPHQRRSWLLFCWENGSNMKKTTNIHHDVWLTMWICAYLILNLCGYVYMCVYIYLSIYLLSACLPTHPSIIHPSILFLPHTTDDLCSLWSLIFPPYSH